MAFRTFDLIATTTFFSSKSRGPSDARYIVWGFISLKLLTNLSIVSGGALTYTSASASTWTIGAGDLTLDVTGDIILDADGGDISLKDSNTQFLKFTNNGGNCEIYNGVADKDIIFKDLGGTEICRLDGSAESLLIATSKKIEFSNPDEYITSDGTDLSIVSGGALTYTSAAESIWTIGGGNLTLDVTGNIILDSQSGTVSISATTASSTASNGALTIAGGLGIGADVNIGDDLSLLSDGAILNFGASGNQVSLSHVPSAGLLLNGNNKLQFNDSAVHISCDVDNYMNLQAATGVNINISGNDTFNVEQNSVSVISKNNSHSNVIIKSTNTTNGEAHLTMISDNSADVGDGFQFKVVNGVLTLSTDHNSIGTYGETILTITGNDTDDNRITAVTGNLDVSAGVDVTGIITCSSDLDIEGDIDMATGKKITWVDDNQYISGSSTGITIETDDTLIINSDTSSTFNTPTAIFTHTSNADLTIKSSNTSDGEAHLTMISDNGEDAGDGFQFKVVNGVLTLSSDHNSANTYGETILTITGHDTATSRTTAVTGNLTVSEDVTISDDLSLLSDASVFNFGADRDINFTHIPDIGLKLNGTINKSTSGLIDGVSKGSFTFTNPCGDLTANTNTGDTTVKSFDNTAYELAVISNYVPPTSATHMEITFNFTIYDENIASEFTLDLLVGSVVADNNIIKSAEQYKYKQKYKMESRNQTNEYSKTFHLTLADLDTSWESIARNIKFKFAGANSNKIYLFTNSLTSITDKYTTANIQYPSVAVKSHFY